MPIRLESWGNIPDSPDLARRLKSASDAKLTPLEFDRDNKSAVFSGDHGVYETHLDHCTCADFGIQQRKGKNLPCKHILRLAMELRLIDLPFKTDASKVREPVRKTDYDPLPVAVAAMESTPGCLEIMSRAFLLHGKGEMLPTSAKEDPVVAFLIDNELLRAEPDGRIDVGPNARNCYNPLRCYLEYRLNHMSDLVYNDDSGKLVKGVKQLSDIQYEGVAELLKQYDSFYRVQIPDPKQAKISTTVFRYIFPDGK